MSESSESTQALGRAGAAPASKRVATRLGVVSGLAVTALLVFVASRTLGSDGDREAAAPAEPARAQAARDVAAVFALPIAPEETDPLFGGSRIPDVPAIVPNVVMSDREREALQAEREALSAENRARMLAFNEKASAMKKYDPLLCAHMDHPLCPPYAMSKAELERLADCGGLKTDAPRFMWREDEPLFDPRWESAQLTSKDRVLAEETLRELRDAFEQQARETWAIEHGDEADAAALDLADLNSLMFRMDRPEGFDDALYQVSAELAGRTPTHSAPPHVVDYLRMMAGAGDRIESELAKTLGDDKAARLRRAAGGWGATGVTHAGCPEDRSSRANSARILEIDAKLNAE